MTPIDIIGLSHDWTFVHEDEVILLYGDKRQRRRIRRKQKLARQKLMDSCEVIIEKKILDWAIRIPSPIAAEFVRDRASRSVELCTENASSCSEFRMLTYANNIQVGDEFLLDNGIWEKEHFSSPRASGRHFLGCPYNPNFFVQMRRPLIIRENGQT